MHIWLTHLLLPLVDGHAHPSVLEPGLVDGGDLTDGATERDTQRERQRETERGREGGREREREGREGENSMSKRIMQL